MRNAHTILVRKVKCVDALGDLGVNGRIILKMALKKQGVRMWTASIWLRIPMLV
jgi:hypothetical protein